METNQVDNQPYRFVETAKAASLEVVLTGGPCAGKSTALSVLSQKLSDYGYKVLVCPETTSLVINAGVDVLGLCGETSSLIELQRHIVRTQRALRQRFREFAAISGAPTIILFDRGEMDNVAYIDQVLFEEMLNEEGLSVVELRDTYDLVVHMVTAANGAEEAYTLSNNAARSETPAQARELDRRTLAAWVGHPRLRIIDNSTDFDSKVNRVLREVTALLGQSGPLEIERKFLLRDPGNIEEFVRCYGASAVEIEQTYLTSARPGVELRVRRRSQAGASSYYRAEKTTVEPGRRLTRERIITANEYDRLCEHRDLERQVITKTRYCFVYEGHYFELDHIRTPRELWVLEVELSDESATITLPDALEIVREVTGEHAFNNAEIARTRM